MMFVKGMVVILLCVLSFALGKSWALYRVEKEKEALELQETYDEWKRFFEALDNEKGGEG